MGSRMGTAPEPRSDAPSARRSSKPRCSGQVVRSGNAEGLPGWLLQGLAEPPPAGALHGSARTCRYSRRLLPTSWGSAYAAICHDIFGLAGIGENYEERVSACEHPPLRAEVSAALPRAGDPGGHPELVLNAIHAFTR